MKRQFLLFVLCIAALTGYAQTNNNSYNLGFEKQDAKTGLPAGWGLGNISKSDIAGDQPGAYKSDSVIKHNGRYSLLIDWTKGYKPWTASNYAINQIFKGSKIKLTGYVKTEDVTEGAGLWMRLDGEDNKNLGFDNMMKRPIKGTTDWKEYTIELDYDQDEVKSIFVGGLISGTGKMWMDNLHITIDGTDITEAKLYTPPPSEYKADQDTEFNNGSGMEATALNSDKIKELTNLGMLWGFIKYYHAGVNKGEYNMDAELFRVLPKVLAAENVKEANKVMEHWVDSFGVPDLCRKCADPDKKENIKILPDYGNLFIPNNFSKKFTDKLVYIRQNRRNEEKNYYIESAPGVGNPVFKHEKAYSKMPYPDAGMRLLALYRYWNMVQYFFPDKHLIDDNWNKVLTEFIPEFWEAADTMAYQAACLKLIARIHDTHANIWGGGTQIGKMKGDLITPFQAKFIEGRLVVTDYYTNDEAVRNKIKIGDVIEKIDGVPLDDLIKKYLPLTPASNYETQLRDMPGSRGFLLRSNKPEAQLTIKRDGLLTDITVTRVDIEKIDLKVDFQGKEKAGYKMLKGNIGYIFPAKLKDDDIDSIETLFDDTKGLIIDMRCYPSTFMTFTYAKWLKPAASPFVKFTFCSTDYPGYFKTGDGPENGRKNKDYYKGKVVIIVNAITQSSAEYQTMALSTAPKVKVIGSTTAGADGNVSEIMLPGGIRTMFSGIGILYPDETETQRKGVKIDRVVKPTIKGIKEGKDELLDAAIGMMSGKW